MSLSAAAVISILEGRYDYHSARAVLKQSTDTAGLEAKGPFDGPAVKKIADAVSRSGTRVDDVVAALREAAPAAGAKKGAKKAAPAPAEAAPAQGDADDSAGGGKKSKKGK